MVPVTPPDKCCMCILPLKELGWKNPEGVIEHGDCLLDGLKDYLYFKRWGCSEKTGLISSLVRTGQMSRDQGLAWVKENEQTEIPGIAEKFFYDIGLSPVDLDDIYNKHFSNVKNLEKSIIFKLGKKLSKLNSCRI